MITFPYTTDNGTNISLLFISLYNFTYRKSIDKTFPLKPLTVITDPRWNGLENKTNIPANVLVIRSLAAKPIVNPEILKSERSGFVSIAKNNIKYN